MTIRHEIVVSLIGRLRANWPKSDFQNLGISVCTLTAELDYCLPRFDTLRFQGPYRVTDYVYDWSRHCVMIKLETVFVEGQTKEQVKNNVAEHIARLETFGFVTKGHLP